MDADISRLQRIRSALRLRTRAREGRNRIWRRLGWLGQEWKAGLPQELHSWEDMLRDGGRHWVQAEYQKRMDPNGELQEELKSLIPNPTGDDPIRILDVG